jgi:SAM-dependent methyltransferase
MWTDPYIREHIVYAHLEPDDDDGTKPYAQVLAETAFWVKRFGAQGKVLDLGCGPGIYLRELAQKGWQGYGIDLNESAVSYAQDLNRDECLSFDIRSGDFLAEAWPPGMDLVIMVYGTFGTIPPKSRQHLVQKLKNTLKPGGRFLMDVFNQEYVDTQREIGSWFTQEEEGFWSPEPHLVLPRVWDYPDLDLLCRRYLVLSSGGVKSFNLWYQTLNHKNLLEYFSPTDWEINPWPDLSGESSRSLPGWSSFCVRRIS